MLVYPNNAIRKDTLTATHVQGWSRVADALENTLDVPVMFHEGAPVIRFALHRDMSAFTLIIGNCDYAQAVVSVLDGNGTEIVRTTVATDGELTIRRIETGGPAAKAREVSLGFNPRESGRLGFLYAGEEWRLPRFVVHPLARLLLRADGGRTFTGQARGFPSASLREFEARFMHNVTYCIETDGGPRAFDDYADLVQTTEAHVIDPYPGRPTERGFFRDAGWERPAVPPMLATLSEYDGKEKRAYDGFYWNTHLKWTEAR